MPCSPLFLSNLFLSLVTNDTLSLDLFVNSGFKLSCEYFQELALYDVLLHVLLDLDHECPLGAHGVLYLMHAAETTAVNFLFEDVSVFENGLTLIGDGWNVGSNGSVV